MKERTLGQKLVDAREAIRQLSELSPEDLRDVVELLGPRRQAQLREMLVRLKGTETPPDLPRGGSSAWERGER